MNKANPDALLELAERCEKATGPQYQLEQEIGAAVFPKRADPYPPCTASLDAAMTLVPEGWERIETTSLNYTDGSVRHYATVNFMQPSRAATPALALAAAAIRARAQQVKHG